MWGMKPEIWSRPMLAHAGPRASLGYSQPPLPQLWKVLQSTRVSCALSEPQVLCPQKVLHTHTEKGRMASEHWYPVQMLFHEDPHCHLSPSYVSSQ